MSDAATPSPRAMIPPSLDCLMGREQVAQALDVCVRTFAGLVSAGQFPPPDKRIGRNPKWRVSTVKQWIASK